LPHDEGQPLDEELLFGIIKLLMSIDARLEGIERLLGGENGEEEEPDS
jgi:hypothetical protein